MGCCLSTQGRLCGVVYGSHTGPGRLFARGSHRAAGLTSLAAAEGIILSKSFVVDRLRWRVGTCWPGSAWGVRVQATRACHPGVAGGMIILETLSHTQVVATVANVRGRVARAQEVSGVEGCACVRVEGELERASACERFKSGFKSCYA